MAVVNAIASCLYQAPAFLTCATMAELKALFRRLHLILKIVAGGDVKELNSLPTHPVELILAEV